MKVTPLLGICCAVLLTSCSKPTGEQLAAKAREAHAAKKFAEAIDYYSQVARQYPHTLIADSALFAIAAIRQNDTHEYSESVKAYRDYLVRYPKGVYAPVAMFLIGFIYNNELHALDSAAAAYRSFINTYPDHDMAASARVELANLGKPPEAFLPKDQAEPGVAATKRGKRR